MSEIEEAVKLFGREDLLSEYGIQDTDTGIEVIMSVKDMIKYYKQDKEIERLNNIINKLDRETYLGMIENQNNNEFSKGLYTAYKYINDRIKELKGADKE